MRALFGAHRNNESAKKVQPAKNIEAAEVDQELSRLVDSVSRYLTRFRRDPWGRVSVDSMRGSVTVGKMLALSVFAERTDLVCLAERLSKQWEETFFRDDNSDDNEEVEHE